MYHWVVTSYYGDDVKPPKRAGEVAIETVHATEASRDIEVECAENRPDIGLVITAPLSPDDQRWAAIGVGTLTALGGLRLRVWEGRDDV